MMAERKKAPLAARLTMYFLLLVVVIGFGFFWYWSRLISPINPDGGKQDFAVQKGESISLIATHLHDQGLIRSDFAFKVLLKFSGDAKHVEPGNFQLSTSMSTSEIMQALRKASVDKSVIFLEGWRDEEMAKQLNTDMGINEQEFLKIAKQGYMFPDTYSFNPDSTAADIAKILEDTFNNKYNSTLQSKIKSQGLTPAQGVILASLVEREARSNEVRTQVASILLKRFRIGMALNVDATVQYAKDSQTLQETGKVDKFWEPITIDDYNNIKSPYNTYLNAGLPPTPICNPSISSINAVANADPSTPYLYYYHDSQGNSYYEKTLEQHNADVAKYQ